MEFTISNELVLVVNSYKDNVDIALPVLLKSVNEPIKIIVVIGGHKEYKMEVKDNMLYIEANHNSIDFTGIITLLDHQSILKIFGLKYFFYIHDTCKLGPTFLHFIKNLELNKSYSYHYPSMNIGLYDFDFIIEFQHSIYSMKNTDPDKVQYFKCRGVELEDFIFKASKNHYYFPNHKDVFEPVDYYGTGVLRIVEYYPLFDFYKIKANWFSKDNYELRC